MFVVRCFLLGESNGVDSTKEGVWNYDVNMAYVNMELWLWIN